MFLRRSLASLARAYKLLFILSVQFWGSYLPPPPQYQKAGYASDIDNPVFETHLDNGLPYAYSVFNFPCGILSFCNISKSR